MADIEAPAPQAAPAPPAAAAAPSAAEAPAAAPPAAEAPAAAPPAAEAPAAEAPAAASPRKHSGPSRGSSNSQCCKRLILALLGFIFLITATLGIGYWFLDPRQPLFSLNNVTLYSLNLSQPNNLLSTKLQVTISAHNTNRRMSFEYGSLGAQARISDTRVTQIATLQDTFQEHGEFTVWTVPLEGDDVEAGPELSQEVKSEMVMINIKVNGWIKWKVWLVMTPKFRLHVSCPAGINLHAGNSNGPGMKLQLVDRCSVHLFSRKL